jgi:DNA invertase Pin-like site-specific DNA recombinase
MRIGYARVSTEEQKTHAQIDALRAANCDFIYEEKRSGGSMNKRPLLRKILANLKKGDVVIVYKMDRIARSLRDLISIQEQIHQAGADFKSLTEIIDTTSPAGLMIFQILGAFAEFERSLIRERTLTGLKAAAKRGRFGGRPAKISKDDLDMVLQLRNKNWNLSEIARHFNVHMSSVKRAIKRGK